METAVAVTGVQEIQNVTRLNGRDEWNLVQLFEPPVLDCLLDWILHVDDAIFLQSII